VISKIRFYECGIDYAPPSGREMALVWVGEAWHIGQYDPMMKAWYVDYRGSVEKIDSPDTGIPWHPLPTPPSGEESAYILAAFKRR
jgi:hypothetical protein